MLHKTIPEFKNDKLRAAVVAAIKVLNKESEYPDLHMRSEKYWEVRRKSPGTLECSARGDRRFSSSHVKLKIHGEERTIEEWFISSKRNKYDKPVSRGEPYEYVIDPFTGKKLYEKDEINDMYKGLWAAYLYRNPKLVEYASKYTGFNDSNYSSSLPIKSSDIISAYVENKDLFLDNLKSGKWYNTILKNKKISLDSTIADASKRNNGTTKVDLTKDVIII